MAFPVVEGRASSGESSAVTSHTVSLPASIAAGELLLIFWGHEAADGGPDQVTDPSGWTRYKAMETLETNDNAGIAWWREATGSEGASVTVSTGSDSMKSSHSSYRISGAEDPDTQPPETSTGQTGNSDTASHTGDALSPTGGSKEYLWIAWEFENGGTPGAPSGYTNRVGNSSGQPSANSASHTAEDTLEAATEDAGDWGVKGTNKNWGAVMVAVHPASAPAGDFDKIIDLENRQIIRQVR